MGERIGRRRIVGEIVSLCAALIVGGCTEVDFIRNGARTSEETTTPTAQTPTDEEVVWFVSVIAVDPDEVTSEEQICKFEDLPQQAQSEFERALDEDGFETRESPSLIGTELECGFVLYEEDYYQFSSTVLH